MGQMMKMVILTALAFTTLLSARPQAGENVGRIPRLVAPEGFGVSIHFTEPRAGELEMIAGAGFRWVRMDFDWGRTEPRRGEYDFSAYDRLVAELERKRLRALFILDYVNPLYDGGQSPHSEAGRAGFARWAAAAVKRLSGKGILWEIYNEPNIAPFWRPKVNAPDYVQLALATSKAIREAAPSETIVGPATSGIDLPFLEECFKGGLLEFWDAVTVHPYRRNEPESAEQDYRNLRLLIARYAPAGKRIPILSGEWGYSAAWDGMDEEKQGKMLARQLLVNLYNQVPLSIWYDWRDDGTDPKEPEHHFGTVRNPYRDGQTPVYEPKPAYRAMRALTAALGGFRYSKRLDVGSPGDWVLLFSRNKEVRIAAWTTAQSARTILIPAGPGGFRSQRHDGSSSLRLASVSSGLSLRLTDAPIYLTPEKPNELLQIVAAWERAPLESLRDGPRLAVLPLTLQNPLSRTIVARSGAVRIRLKPGQIGVIPRLADLKRSPEQIPIRHDWIVEGLGRMSQSTLLMARNPLKLTVLPVVADSQPGTSDILPIVVGNPSGEPFLGVVELTGVVGAEPAKMRVALDFKAGQREIVVGFPGSLVSPRFTVGARVRDREGQILSSIPERQYEPIRPQPRPRGFLAFQDYDVEEDGDPAVPVSHSIAIAPAPIGTPFAPERAARLRYSFSPGWKFLRVEPRSGTAAPIDGKPRSLGMWIYSDGKGLAARVRFRDSTGQTFQPEGEKITWTGWKYVTFPLDGSDSAHWMGANDGVVHHPIQLDTLFLLDNTSKTAVAGDVFFGSPTLIF